MNWLLHHLLDPIYRYFRTMRLPLLIVVINGSDTDLGLIQTAVRNMQRWYRDKVDIVWRVDYDRRTVSNFQEWEIRGYQSQMDDPVPAIYVICDLDLLDGGNWGRTNGQSVLIAGKGKNIAELFAHELGHILSLRHQSGTFMNSQTPDTPNTFRFVASDQVESMRREARLYRV